MGDYKEILWLFKTPAKMNVLQYVCVDMHGRAPLGLTPPSDPSDGCGAVAGSPFLPSELYVGLEGV